MKKFIIIICCLFGPITYAYSDFVITDVYKPKEAGFVITDVYDPLEEELESLKRELSNIIVQKEAIEARIKEIEDSLKEDEKPIIIVPDKKQIIFPWIGPFTKKDNSLKNVEWKTEKIKTGCVNGVCYFADRYWFRQKK